VLLRPLPFPNSGRLVVLSDHLQGIKIAGGGDEVGVTVPDIIAYTRDTHSFTALGGYQGAAFELSGTREPAQVNASRLTAGVFSALGVAPQLGRYFTAEEDQHHQQVAVLSYATWRTRFHADPQVSSAFGLQIAAEILLHYPELVLSQTGRTPHLPTWQ
jgi:hypothetical protein